MIKKQLPHHTKNCLIRFIFPDIPRNLRFFSKQATVISRTNRKAVIVPGRFASIRRSVIVHAESLHSKLFQLLFWYYRLHSGWKQNKAIKETNDSCQQFWHLCFHGLKATASAAAWQQFLTYSCCVPAYDAHGTPLAPATAPLLRHIEFQVHSEQQLFYFSSTDSYPFCQHEFLERCIYWHHRFVVLVLHWCNKQWNGK